MRNKPLFVALLGLFLLSGCFGNILVTPTPPPVAPTAAAPVSAPPTPLATSTALPSPTTSAAIAERFSGEEALTHVRKLAEEIGSRPAGSTQEQAAADYILKILASLGLRAQPQPFSYVLERSRLEVVAPQGLSFEAFALGGSKTGNVEGALVAAGVGRPQDFPESAAGKVALVRRGGIPGEAPLTFQEKVAHAAAAGALGALIFNNRSGNFFGALREPSGIPAVSLAQEDGERLLKLLEEGEVHVRLAARTLRDERHSRNVIAEAPGRSPTVVVLGGHYDSVAEGPGANDNASGVAVALEAARALARGGYPYTLRVIAFGGEEDGLKGSLHYVQGLSAQEKQQILAMINLDMVGVGDTLNLGGDEELVRGAQEKAQQRGLRVGQLRESSRGGSDHAAFAAAGIPVLFLHWSDDPRYHTSEDKASFVSVSHLQQTGDLLLGVLEDLARP